MVLIASLLLWARLRRPEIDNDDIEMIFLHDVPGVLERFCLMDVDPFASQ